MENETNNKGLQDHISTEWKPEIERLEKLLKEKNKKKYRTKQYLNQRKQQFLLVKEGNALKLMKLPKKIKRAFRTIISYLLGRRNRKYLYSRKYRQKDASNKLKKYKDYLYQYGFREKALLDLENLYRESENHFIKSTIAWELALWYANKYTKYGAKKALTYISVAVSKEKNKEQLRKAAIIKAECHGILNENDVGKHLIQQMLMFQAHPDLYLAAANLEEAVEKRLECINRALDYYGIMPIMINEAKEAKNHYDKLSNAPINEKINEGPKVSIIIPAYNAENGIDTAIDSILAQTWQNIEILIVDDHSKDSTKEVVSAYVKTDKRIKLLSTPENSGAYVARNIALKEATGEFVTINDSDDWSHMKKIEIQVKHLINNPDVIANTSEQARMTEELRLYRRGKPGAYIFTNMSSLMFRRASVMERVGYWDQVRFAGDSEFIKRLIRVFGSEKVVNLQTGPLSFPRQSNTSLTGNSAFGYNGFFMGARKEYAEAHVYYHKKADSLYYPFIQKERPYPVPEPMWPKKEKKVFGQRFFDFVIVGDFRLPDDRLKSMIDEIKFNQQLGYRTGLIQMSYYDFKLPKDINPRIREQIDGHTVQMLVYGEKIACTNLIVKHVGVLQEKQRYVPEVQANDIRVVIDELPKHHKTTSYNIRDCAFQVEDYFAKRGIWYPENEQIRQSLIKNERNDLKYIRLSTANWNRINQDQQSYTSYLAAWILDKNPYTDD